MTESGVQVPDIKDPTAHSGPAGPVSLGSPTGRAWRGVQQGIEGGAGRSFREVPLCAGC